MKISKERIAEIFEAYYSGLPLTKIMTSATERQSFYEELNRNADLSNKYSRAQSVRAELFGDQVVEIADNEPDFQRARNMMDARKYLASKLNPQKWGERLDVNLVQTVDIAGALEELRKRAGMLPGRYPEKSVDSQIIETIEDNRNGSTGYKPDDGGEDLFGE